MDNIVPFQEPCERPTEYLESQLYPWFFSSNGLCCEVSVVTPLALCNPVGKSSGVKAGD